jgi:hypothetical protein
MGIISMSGNLKGNYNDFTNPNDKGNITAEPESKHIREIRKKISNI